MSSPKIKLDSLRNVIRALEALDGHNEIVLDPKGVQRAVTVPYKLDRNTRWDVATDLRVLRTEEETLEAERIKLVLEFSPENREVAKESDEKQNRFVERWTDALKVETSPTGLKTLRRSALLPEGVDNPIPPSVLAALDPLLVD